MKAAVLTISDGVFQGRREDRSGPVLREALEAWGVEVVAHGVVPDEEDRIGAQVVAYADELGVDLIVTTGGTGLSVRDVTPEAIGAVADREIPGYGELMRAKSFEITPFALLSRAGAYTRGQTLILTLPGSPKGARECLDIVWPAVPHTIQILHGQTDHPHPP
jgi:molybdenum cofactor synthesis domain-containing protein